MSARRIAIAVSLAVATTGFVTAVAPTPASADIAIKVVEIPCPSWVPSAVGVWGLPESIVSVNSTFEVADSRIVVNDLDTSAMATFTSQVSRTFTIAVTSGASFNNLFGFLNLNVSNTITSSTTTQLGVSTTTTVPAHSAVIGDYGVEAFDVTFMGYEVNRRSIGGCWVKESSMGHEVEYTPAPTYIQGWRLREA
jgi:hypothetical protein